MSHSINVTVPRIFDHHTYVALHCVIQVIKRLQKTKAADLDESLFPPTLEGLKHKYSGRLYKELTASIAPYSSLILHQTANNLFTRLSKSFRPMGRFMTFIENWIPFAGEERPRATDNCGTVFEEIVESARSNFQDMIVLSENDLYLLFQLVTINYVLRNRDTEEG